MTDTENFEFDPLPGDAPAPAMPAPTEPAPKRGRPAKPERKSKRGPRRVVPTNAIQTPPAAENVLTNDVQKPPRKKREPKADLGPEFGFIKQFMELTEPTRKRVLAVLNKVFS